MITEDYVSFEIAKLLKEKRFDVYGDSSFNSGIEVFAEYSPSGALNKCIASKPHQKAYPAPTLQMAIKWSMKNHNICIVSLPVVTDDDGDAGCLWNYIISRKLEVLHKSEYLYESPEIALNDAIKYCLEHLI